MLRDYQVPHFRLLLPALRKFKSILDSSDTGTGKTYVALALCKALGAIPLVVGTRAGRAGWGQASEKTGVQIEYVNYEKLRGRRKTVLIPCPICRLNGQPFLGPFITRQPAETEWAQEVPHGKGSYIKWKNNYYVIIFDEVHRCGGSTSLNSKLLIAAKRQAEYVITLSATAADDPRQMKALGFVLGLHGLSKKQPVPYMTWLMRHGCTPGVFGGMDFTDDPEKKQKAFVRLHSEIFPAHGARMRKAEIPGFPKTVIETLLLTDETGKAQKIAEELHGLNGEKTPDLAGIMKCRQGLEHLKVAHFLDLAKDSVLSSRVVLFLNFTDPLFELLEALRKEFGHQQVGYISGAQVGKQGDAERFRFLAQFQADKLAALVCNIQAAGENINLHGRIDRTTFISPCESGKQFKQVVGRVNRDGGGFSTQYPAYFKGTREEIVAERMKQKGMHIDLFNDADFLV